MKIHFGLTSLKMMFFQLKYNFKKRVLNLEASIFPIWKLNIHYTFHESLALGRLLRRPPGSLECSENDPKQNPLEPFGIFGLVSFAAWIFTASKDGIQEL